MEKSLADILGKELADKLKKIPEPDYLYSWKNCQEKLDYYKLLAKKNPSLSVIQLGHSLQKKDIEAIIYEPENHQKTFLAWGSPHPEEPLGAHGLLWMLEETLKKPLPGLEKWRLVFVLCADPDGNDMQHWFHERGAYAFTKGSWRSTHLGLEVDYGFPIDRDPFYQPFDYKGKCHTKAECRDECGSEEGEECLFSDYPYSPLPESLALAHAIDKYNPDLVVAMHHTHTGGDYTFLLEKEKIEVLEDLTQIPKAAGLSRHLGESIDRGPRWKRDMPDLLRERGLEYFQKRLEKHPMYEKGMLYAGNTSAACYLEAKEKRMQFVCPETGLFYHPQFSNTNLQEEKITVKKSIEERKKGKYEVTRILIDNEWVICHQEKSSKKEKEWQEVVIKTRGMHGVEALIQKRKAFNKADQLWEKVQQLPFLNHHLYQEERAKITVPGKYVHDQSMLIFRVREDYNQIPTKAQVASFKWLWPLHTACILSNFQNFLLAQKETKEIKEIQRELTEVQEELLKDLPDDLLKGAPYKKGITSQMARVIRLMQAENERTNSSRAKSR